MPQGAKDLPVGRRAAKAAHAAHAAVVGHRDMPGVKNKCNLTLAMSLRVMAIIPYPFPDMNFS